MGCHLLMRSHSPPFNSVILPLPCTASSPSFIFLHNLRLYLRVCLFHVCGGNCLSSSSGTKAPWSYDVRSVLFTKVSPLPGMLSGNRGCLVNIHWMIDVLSLVLITHDICCLFFSGYLKSRPTLWDPMDCSTLGFPVLHHLPELAQTHIH